MLAELPERFAARTSETIQTLVQRKFWRREAFVFPVCVALVSRIIILVVADLLMRFTLVGRPRTLPFTGPISVWERKDALWYIAIAQSGYNYSTVVASRANFFPLYPLLIHIVEPVFALFPTSDPYALAGVALSWILFAIACVGLYGLTADFFGRSAAIGAVLLLSLFPFSLYYGAVYTESIYLALAVWAFVAIERQQWWAAGALAAIASASRPPGLIIGACVALAYVIDWVRYRRPLRANVLALALTPLGAVSYMFYCWVRWGNPLAYVEASKVGWDGGHLQIGGVRYVAHVLRHPISWITTYNPDHELVLFAILLMVGFLAVLPLVLRLLGPTYAFFTVASILAPILDFPSANSLGRYLSVVFPIFMVMGYLLRGHPRVARTLYVVGAILLILFATYFIAGYGLS